MNEIVPRDRHAVAKTARKVLIIRQIADITESIELYLISIHSIFPLKFKTSKLEYIKI